MTIDRTEGRSVYGGARDTRMRACALIFAVIVSGTVMMSGASTAAARQPKLPRRQSERIPPRWKPPVGLMAHVDRGLDPADPEVQWGDHDPRGVILRGPARWDSRVDVPMGLVAYLDRGVDPASSDATATRQKALEDAEYFQPVVLGPDGRRYDSWVERSDTGAGIPRWAFTARKPGDYAISVRWGPFTSDPIHVRVKLGKWKPIAVVAKKGMGMLDHARVGEEYSLIAYLEYENVDSQFVDQKTRGEDSRYLTVKVAKGGVEIPGLEGRGGSAWGFKATEPGNYEVWAEWRPPGGKDLDSRNNGKPPFELRVVHEFAGKYRGSVQYRPKSGGSPRMSKFDFTVDDNGLAKGTFRYGDSEEFYNGTFKGTVERVDVPFGFFERARLEDKGSMTRDLTQLSPYIKQWVRQAQDLERQLREAARSVDDPTTAHNLQVLEASLRAVRQMLEDSGVHDRSQEVLVNLHFRSVGGILNADGTLGTPNGSLPVSATSFGGSVL